MFFFGFSKSIIGKSSRLESESCLFLPAQLKCFMLTQHLSGLGAGLEADHRRQSLFTWLNSSISTELELLVVVKLGISIFVDQQR